MGLANGMKGLSEEILESFRARIMDNDALVSSVQQKMGEHRESQKQTAEILRANAASLRVNLDHNEKARVANFDKLMDGIKKDIKGIEKEVKSSKNSTNNLLKEFSEARNKLSNELDAFLSHENKQRIENEKTRMAEYELFITKISDEVSSIFSYTNEMLNTFSDDHKEMSLELQKDLANNKSERLEYTQGLLKNIQERIAEISRENNDAASQLKQDLKNGETDRIKQYNELFDRISSEVSELRKSTASMLDGYARDRSKGGEAWSEMQKEIAAHKNGNTPVVTHSVVKAVAPAAPKMEIAPQVIVDIPPVEEVVSEVFNKIVESVDDSSLEEKILDYIKTHTYGVKVSEMELPLRETRMKIGFAAKCLLDAGKVSKVDNLYYPAKKGFN